MQGRGAQLRVKIQKKNINATVVLQSLKGKTLQGGFFPEKKPPCIILETSHSLKSCSTELDAPPNRAPT
jgi:hypothetical protein